MRKPRLLVGVLLVVMVILIPCFFHLGSFLVVENPQPSNAILVLAGDVNDKRYDRGIELLRRGYGEQMFLDASEDFTLYGHTYADWARQFVAENSTVLFDFLSRKKLRGTWLDHLISGISAPIISFVSLPLVWLGSFARQGGTLLVAARTADRTSLRMT